MKNDYNDSIFTIDCEHIILREYQLDDLDALYELTFQHHVIEFLPDWQASKEQRADWLPNYEIKENKAFLNSLPNVHDLPLRLGIILKETGQFIGWCCTGIKEELPQPNREVVYAISNDYLGKGYTTEAVNGLVEFLFNNTNIEVINGLALPHNIGSNKVLTKCHFQFVGQRTIDHHVFNQYLIRKE